MKTIRFYVLGFGLWLWLGQLAQAGTHTVTQTNDSFTAHSLRAAIMAVNRNGGRQLIVLSRPRGQQTNAPLVFYLSRGGADEDKARTGDLDIRKGRVTIMGNEPVTIDASALGDRVFQIFPKASLTLVNVTIIGGSAPGNGSSYLNNGESGGAFYNAGSLTLVDCNIIGNQSGAGNEPMGNIGGTSGGDGGGIYNTGKLTMVNCVLTENAAGNGVDGAPGGKGGGIMNDGSCWLTNCMFAGNAGGDGGAPSGNLNGWAGSGGVGGAICNAGTMILSGCTVTNNWSGLGKDGGQWSGWINGINIGSPGAGGGDGGGIYNSGGLVLDSCVVSGNQSGNGGNAVHASGGSGGNGAGIFNSGQVSLQSSLITENRCGDGGNGGTGYAEFLLPAGNGGNGGSGGGIYNAANLSDVEIVNSLIQQNAVGLGGEGGTYFGGTTNGVPGMDGVGPDLGGNY